MSPGLKRILLALTFVTGIVDAATFLGLGSASAYSLIALLALAMGVRNTAVRGFGGPNFATTVLNLTVTSLTSASPGVASGGDLAARAAALAAILAGAVTGALLLEADLALPIATAAAITCVAGLAHRREVAA